MPTTKLSPITHWYLGKIKSGYRSLTTFKELITSRKYQSDRNTNLCIGTLEIHPLGTCLKTCESNRIDSDSTNCQLLVANFAPVSLWLGVITDWLITRCVINIERNAAAPCDNVRCGRWALWWSSGLCSAVNQFCCVTDFKRPEVKIMENDPTTCRWQQTNKKKHK